MMYQNYIDTNSTEGGVDKVRYYIDQLLDGFTWKIVLSLCGGLLCNMEHFYSSLLWLFLSLFTLDLMTGIMKARMKSIPISSRRLRDSVYKLAAYMVLLTSVIIAGKIDPIFTSVTPIIYYYYMFTEFKSIIENAEEMGVPIPSFLEVLTRHRLQEHGHPPVEKGKTTNGTHENK